MTDAGDWQRLSVREGRRAVPEFAEGFSEQATHALVYWLEGELGYRSSRNEAEYDQLVMSVALVCGVTLNPGQTFSVSLMRQLLNAASRSDDLMLDVLDATLARGFRHAPDTLTSILRDANSVWTVRADGRALIRRVSPAEERTFAQAVEPADSASAELMEAWVALYGTTPNYSDAWDHAIKALEDVLVPIVAPANKRASLGTVATELEKGIAPVSFTLGSTATLGAILRLVWPNPDRHGGGQKRSPEYEETTGVVNLAVNVLGWVRAGLIRRDG